MFFPNSGAVRVLVGFNRAVLLSSDRAVAAGPRAAKSFLTTFVPVLAALISGVLIRSARLSWYSFVVRGHATESYCRSSWY